MPDMNKLFSLFFAAFVLLISNSVQADFVTKYSDWRDLNASEKSGYVMGVWDGLRLMDHVGKDKNREKMAELIGIDSCGSELKLNSRMIVDAVDTTYLRNTQRWANGATLIVYGTIRHMCLKYINHTHRNWGLELLKPWENWK